MNLNKTNETSTDAIREKNYFVIKDRNNGYINYTGHNRFLNKETFDAKAYNCLKDAVSQKELYEKEYTDTDLVIKEIIFTDIFEKLDINSITENSSSVTHGFFVRNLAKGFIDASSFQHIVERYKNGMKLDESILNTLMFIDNVTNDNLPYFYNKGKAIEIVKFCNENLNQEVFVVEKYKCTFNNKYIDENEKINESPYRCNSGLTELEIEFIRKNYNGEYGIYIFEDPDTNMNKSVDMVELGYHNPELFHYITNTLF